MCELPHRGTILKSNIFYIRVAQRGSGEENMSCSSLSVKNFLWLIIYYCWLFNWVTCERTSSSLSSGGSAGGGGGGGTSIPPSPISKWDSSWIASCAQGTAIAMNNKDDCMVLFLRTPSTRVWKPPIVSSMTILPKQLERTYKQQQEEDENLEKINDADDDENGEFPGMIVHMVEQTQIQFAPSWLSFPKTICAMTGFAPDVEHLCRILQRSVESYDTIYDKRMTTFKMVERFSDILQDAAFSNGSRPFGVQALFVGVDDVNPNHPLCVYSMDPSGSWQSWGGTTAIGRHARQVREQLANKRKEDLLLPRSSSSQRSVKETIEQIIHCWFEACKSENINFQPDEDSYCVLLLKTYDNNNKNDNIPTGANSDENQITRQRKKRSSFYCRLFVVDDATIQEMIDDAIAATQAR